MQKKFHVVKFHLDFAVLSTFASVGGASWSVEQCSGGAGQLMYVT